MPMHAQTYTRNLHAPPHLWHRYVCFKAVQEARQLDRDDLEMKFRRVSTVLTKAEGTRMRRVGGGEGKGGGGVGLRQGSGAQASVKPWRLERLVVPPPRSIIPDSWVEGGKFGASSER